MEVTAASSTITTNIIINTAHYQWAFGPSSSRTEETGVSQSTASKQGGIAWQKWTTDDGDLPSKRRNPARSVRSGKDPGGPAQAIDKGDQGLGHVGSSRNIYTDLVLDRRKWLVRSQKGVRKESR